MKYNLKWKTGPKFRIRDACELPGQRSHSLYDEDEHLKAFIFQRVLAMVDLSQEDYKNLRSVCRWFACELKPKLFRRCALRLDLQRSPEKWLPGRTRWHMVLHGIAEHVKILRIRIRVISHNIQDRLLLPTIKDCVSIILRNLVNMQELEICTITDTGLLTHRDEGLFHVLQAFSSPQAKLSLLRRLVFKPCHLLSLLDFHPTAVSQSREIPGLRAPFWTNLTDLSLHLVYGSTSDQKETFAVFKALHRLLQYLSKNLVYFSFTWVEIAGPLPVALDQYPHKYILKATSEESEALQMCSLRSLRLKNVQVPTYLINRFLDNHALLPQDNFKSVEFIDCNIDSKLVPLNDDTYSKGSSLIDNFDKRASWDVIHTHGSNFVASRRKGRGYMTLTRLT